MFELILHDNTFTKLPMVQKFFTNCFRETKGWLSLTELFSALLELFYVWQDECQNVMESGCRLEFNLKTVKFKDFDVGIEERVVHNTVKSTL